MSDVLAKPVSILEASVLSQAVFAHLRLSTIGELVEVDAETFLHAAYAVAADDQRISPALAEVNMILADMELSLARPTNPPVVRRTIADDGPPLPDYRYLGTFDCGGALVLGEVRFVGRAADTKLQAEATIDFLEMPPKSQIGEIQLARLVVEPGRWDVYERNPFRGGPSLDVLARHRNASASLRGRHLGGLRMPDNHVAIVDASHAEDAISHVRGHAKQVFDWGASLTLSRPVEEDGSPSKQTASYFWRTFTEEEDPAISVITVQSYAGELPGG